MCKLPPSSFSPSIHTLECTTPHSQACIAGSKKGDTARLLVKTGELETPLALCALRDGGAENANLDLVFDEYAEFSVAGAAAVHVTGYLMPEFEGGGGGGAGCCPQLSRAGVGMCEELARPRNWEDSRLVHHPSKSLRCMPHRG